MSQVCPDDYSDNLLCTRHTASCAVYRHCSGPIYTVPLYINAQLRTDAPIADHNIRVHTFFTYLLTYLLTCTNYLSLIEISLTGDRVMWYDCATTAGRIYVLFVVQSPGIQ